MCVWITHTHALLLTVPPHRWVWIGAAVLFGSSIILTACQAFFLTVLDGEFVEEAVGMTLRLADWESQGPQSRPITQRTR